MNILRLKKELQDIKKIENEISIKDNKNEKKKATKNKLSYKEQREFEDLPKEIEDIEEEIKAINLCLSNPDCYKDKGLVELGEQLNDLQHIYEEKSEKYLELLELYESFA